MPIILLATGLGACSIGLEPNHTGIPWDSGGGGGGGGGTQPTGCSDLDFDLDGYSECDGDCDDSDSSTYPGAAEYDSAKDCMTDADDDGWGSAVPATGVQVGSDCDDSSAAVNPDAEDVPNDGNDANCDGDDSGSTVYAEGQGDMPIIDNQSVTSLALVEDCSYIYDISVSVNITHTYISDLQVSLRSPGNTLVLLHDHTGGSSQNIVGTYAISGGSLLAAESLTAFLGGGGNGSWTLNIMDTVTQDNGWLNSWSVTLGCP